MYSSLSYYTKLELQMQRINELTKHSKRGHLATPFSCLPLPPPPLPPLGFFLFRHAERKPPAAAAADQKEDPERGGRERERKKPGGEKERERERAAIKTQAKRKREKERGRERPQSFHICPSLSARETSSLFFFLSPCISRPKTLLLLLWLDCWRRRGREETESLIDPINIPILFPSPPSLPPLAGASTTPCDPVLRRPVCAVL